MRSSTRPSARRCAFPIWKTGRPGGAIRRPANTASNLSDFANGLAASAAGYARVTGDHGAKKQHRKNQTKELKFEHCRLQRCNPRVFFSLVAGLSGLVQNAVNCRALTPF